MWVKSRKVGYGWRVYGTLPNTFLVLKDNHTDKARRWRWRWWRRRRRALVWFGLVVVSRATQSDEGNV